MKSSRIFLLLNISLIIGIALAGWLPIKLLSNDLLWFSLIMAGGLSLFIIWPYKKIRIAVLMGCFLFLGLWRFSLALPEDSPNKIWHYNGQEVSLIGTVIKEPDMRQAGRQLTIKVDKLNSQNNLAVTGLILVITNLYPQYQYGDKLYLRCALKAPEPFAGFSYDQYLARYNIYAVCYYPQIELLKAGESTFSFYGRLLSFKQGLAQKIDQSLNQAEASLAKAILLGYKKDIAEVWRLRFSQVGLSHLVAISGLHISIIGLLLMQLLLALGLNRRHIFYFSSIILWFYIFLIGLPASAVRAGIMGWLVLLAIHLGRLNKSLNAVVLAASLMLLVNPRIFWADIGWQLSFTAVLGIIYLYPLIKKYLKIKIKFISEIIAITLSAQLATWPLVAYHFSQVSLIAPLANLLVIWLLPALIILIITALLFSLILPTAIAWAPVWLILHYILFIAEWLSKIPFSYLNFK